MTRRDALTGAAATPLAAAAAALSERDATRPAFLEELLATTAVANAALLRGDTDTYCSLITLAEDFVLMSPFGGTPSRGVPTAATWEQIGKFFRNGTLRQEFVQACTSSDMVVLAIIEHGHGEVGGLPAQQWSLRVTLVYRRDGTAWRLVHRHADPLAGGISLEQSALLARAGGPGNP